MQRFTYKAYDKEGREQTGRIDAFDLSDARKTLHRQNLKIADLHAIHSHSIKNKRVPWRHYKALSLRKLFADLAVLLNAGLGLDASLSALRSTLKRQTDQDFVSSILIRLASGSPPSVAFSALPHLQKEFLALIASGEKSARLPHVINIIAADLEKRDCQRKKLIDASLYPLFLILMMIGALAIITFVLVPSLGPVFESSGQRPPLMIQALANVGTFLQNPIIIGFGLILCLSLAIMWVTRPARARDAFASIVLNIPLMGGVITKSVLGRYLQSLSLLLENSVPVPDALVLSAQCCPHPVYQKRMEEMREAVLSGKRLPDIFRDCGYFPESIVSLVSVGDEVNQLPLVLGNASRLLHGDAQRTLDRCLALLTPVITIILGALVGGLVISVMSALLSVNDLGVS